MFNKSAWFGFMEDKKIKALCLIKEMNSQKRNTRNLNLKEENSSRFFSGITVDCC